MAAMTGLGKRSIRRSTPVPKRMNVSTLPPEKAEPRSAPAQKIFSPAPVMMSERTSVSLSTDESAAFNSVISVSLMALAGGRLRVMTRKDSSRVTISVSYAIAADSFDEHRRHRIGGVHEPVGALAGHPRRGHLVHRSEEDLGRDFDGQIVAQHAGGDAVIQYRRDEIEV